MSRRADLEDIARRIGGPNSVTWQGCWIALGFALFFGAAAAATARAGFGWLLPVVVGHFAAYGVLALLRRRITGRDSQRPHPLRAIAAIAGAAVVGTLASGIVGSVVFGGSRSNSDSPADTPVSPALAALSAASTIVAFTLLTSFSAVVVDAWAEHRRRSVDYQSLVELLVDLRSRGFARVAAARDAVRRTALDALATLASDKGTLATPELQERVRSTALDVIRPLSHQLANEPLPPDVAPAPSKWSSRTFIIDATTPRVFAPVTLALLAEIPVLLYVLIDDPGRGAALGAPITLIGTAFIAWVANAAARRFTGNDNVVSRAAWWAGSIVLAAGGQAVVWLSTVGSDTGRAAAVLSCFTMAFFGVASPTWRAARTALTRERRESDGLVAAIGMERSRLAQYEWAERVGLARTLHGQVQSALLACALRLGNSADTAEGGESTRLQLGHTLSDLVHAIDGSNTDLDARTACQNLAATWRGVCDVAFEPLPSDALVVGSSTTSAFVAMITEAVSNAVRHGRASRVDISAVPVGSDCLDVSVRAHGDGLGQEQSQHLGFALFDEVALSWALTPAEGGTILTARLPIERRAISPAV